MTRKKEDPEKVKARVKRYLETHSQLLITGLSDKEKQSFIDIKGLESFSHSKKLSKLIECWNEQNKQPVKKETVKPMVKEVKVIPKVKKPLDKKILIETSSELDLKFMDFLHNFKVSNQTKSGLRRKGTEKKGEKQRDKRHQKAGLNLATKV